MITLSILAVVALLSVLMFPRFVGDHPRPTTIDVSRMKQLALSVILYASDSDERLPLAPTWADASQRYRRDEDPTHCYHLSHLQNPAVFGHVMEVGMTGRNLRKVERPSEEPMIFDGAKVERNAVDSLLGVRLTKVKDRHICTLAFADGHVKARAFEVVVPNN
ncbi:MAG TPA: hypothetical protein PKA27_11615 [Fimbriimonadaceae bacterium]|nr:hypothetical protein [Fimbriimonadaceae bacterium]